MTPSYGRMQLTFYSSYGDIPVKGREYGTGGASTSVVFDPAVFRGLTLAQIESPVRTTVHFQISKEPGTFVCDGEFENGYGTGPFLFQPDAGFVGQMTALGIPNLQDQQLISMAILGVGPAFLRDLRSSGFSVSTFNDLVGLWVQGVTGDYIREIQELGYTPSANDLIGMRVQGVTADFAREVRQMYPSATINNLIGMRVQGVTMSFARDVRQTYPSASINDLIGMRVRGIR